VFVFLKHRANIERLMQGTESRIGSQKTAAS
jgi:glycerol-3-phosphate acyltransferase PlsY